VKVRLLPSRIDDLDRTAIALLTGGVIGQLQADCSRSDLAVERLQSAQSESSPNLSSPWSEPSAVDATNEGHDKHESLGSMLRVHGFPYEAPFAMRRPT